MDNRPDHATLQQAADWFARLASQPEDPALREAWRHWHEQQESHRQAWVFVERVSQRFNPLQQDADRAGRTLDSLRHGQQSRRQMLRNLSIFGGASLLGWIGWRQAGLGTQLMAWQADYRTAGGEVREQLLADGTRLWLNSATAVDVDFSRNQRRLRLYRGEILISTASDPRPLRVETAQGSLRPLGTRFSVRLEAQRTRLNVYQGAVQVQCQASGAERIVDSGLGLTFDSRDIAPDSPVQQERQAWSQGLLLANDISLGQFIEELAVYRSGHLGVDPRIAGLRVMGAYPLHDTEQVLAMLEGTLPIRIQRTLPWWVTLEPR